MHPRYRKVQVQRLWGKSKFPKCKEASVADVEGIYQEMRQGRQQGGQVM